MSEKDETIVGGIAQAVGQLQPGKKEYLLGFAEGMAAMSPPPAEPEDKENPAP